MPGSLRQGSGTLGGEGGRGGGMIGEEGAQGGGVGGLGRGIKSGDKELVQNAMTVQSIT